MEVSIRFLGMRRNLLGLIVGLAGMLASGCGLALAAVPLSAALGYASPVGLSTQFLQEQHGRLELSDAIAAYQSGKFIPGKSPVLNFGIGAKPVWIHFAVDNPAAAPVQKKLSIETA